MNAEVGKDYGYGKGDIQRCRITLIRGWQKWVTEEEIKSV